MRIGRRLRALLWFVFWIGFFSLAFTRAYWIAESLLSVALVTALVVFSVAKVWKLWKYRSDSAMREAHISSGQGGIFNNSRWRRWALDDYVDSKDNGHPQ